MTLPFFDLRQGVNLDQSIVLLQTLATNIYTDAQPVGSTMPGEKRDDYVRWATSTERQLRSVVSIRDAAAFFSGPRHRDICSMTPGSQLLPMISAEIDTQADRLSAMAEELVLAKRLLEGADICLVSDTSFYIEHEEKIEDIDFHQLAQRQGSVRLLIPIVVVDELDSLKRASSRQVRWRAGYTLAVLDRVITDPPAPGAFAPGSAVPRRGEVTFQIVLDPPDHPRMSINDDEVVDRCLACTPFVSDLTVITYDTGQATRARTAGLNVNKLAQRMGDEPET